MHQVVVGFQLPVSNLPAGTYTLTVTDSCSTKTNSVTVGPSALALATRKAKTDASCFRLSGINASQNGLAVLLFMEKYIEHS
jgi:hypothetical protein